jgi:hypothetical protein
LHFSFSPHTFLFKKQKKQKMFKFA